MRFTDVEGQLRAALAASEGTAPVAVYLFGSVARGDAAANSDVDVAVLFDCELPKTLAHPSIRLASVLEEKLGRTVQVIVLNDAPVDLVHRVLRDGRLLLDRDPGCRIRFEIKARNEYFDLLPVLRRYRKLERRPA